jgi:hypothetical protein
LFPTEFIQLQTKDQFMKTFTKVYSDYSQARRAVTDLEAAGIPSSDISMMANKTVSERHGDVDEASPTATGAGVGAVVGGGAGLLAGLGLLAIPGLGPIVAAGWLASTAVGAVAGGATGGIVGALMDSGVSEEHAHVYSEAVRRGSTLVSVRADENRAGEIESLLNGYQPLDPDRLGADYRKTGWKTFDPNAGEYEASELERKSLRR